METAAPPQASMIVSPEARVREMPCAAMTVDGSWIRERWRSDDLCGFSKSGASEEEEVMAP